ncbi:MAG TPA: thioredoxin family protein [bacterium]|nr:thioredoxin family protein [bacterium]
MMRLQWLAPLALLTAVTALAQQKKEPPGLSELEIGKTAPEFSLPGTDGKTYSYKDIAGEKGTLVIFTCNHCPYAVAYQKRIIDLTARYKPQGIGVVAISSNDAKAYPDDSFAKMKERADSMKYNFPYLYDESQAVALQYGPKVTPHIFLFDAKGTLVYRGRIDDSAKENEVKKRELTDALDALVAGRGIPTATTTAFGCSIKWRADVLATGKKSSS